MHRVAEREPPALHEPPLPGPVEGGQVHQVGDAEQKAVSANKGAVVKRLGDGAMAVFGDPEQAVMAALDSQRAVSKIKVEGYRPELRAGVHRGTPRKVKRDFLGIDVNIAARVGPGPVSKSSAT